MYMDDDEIGRAVAADLEECWQGEGWYRICFTDGMGSYPATWYETEGELADDLRGAYGDAGEIHLPYAEISVIDQAVEKVWQGEGWYRVTGGDGEKWEPDFYVTRECLVPHSWVQGISLAHRIEILALRFPLLGDFLIRNGISKTCTIDTDGRFKTDTDFFCHLIVWDHYFLAVSHHGNW